MFCEKKVLLEISQNSLESICARVSFLIKLQASACNFIKNQSLAEVFSCELCEISKNTVFTEHFRTTNSTNSDTCFEFRKKCEESAIRSINKADVRLDRKERTCLKVLLQLLMVIFCHINCSCRFSQKKQPCFVVVIFLWNVFDPFQPNVPLRKKAVFP